MRQNLARESASAVVRYVRHGASVRLHVRASQLLPQLLHADTLARVVLAADVGTLAPVGPQVAPGDLCPHQMLIQSVHVFANIAEATACADAGASTASVPYFSQATSDRFMQEPMAVHSQACAFIMRLMWQTECWARLQLLPHASAQTTAVYLVLAAFTCRQLPVPQQSLHKCLRPRVPA